MVYVIYNKKGERFEMRHSVDVAEAIKSGEYFIEKPSFKKVKKSKEKT